MRSLKDSVHGVVDLGVVLVIGIAFAGLMVIAYIIWELYDQLLLDNAGAAPTRAFGDSYNSMFNSSRNITGGFDNAVNLLLVAITIFILAIAISAILLLRGR